MGLKTGFVRGWAIGAGLSVIALGQVLAGQATAGDEINVVGIWVGETQGQGGLVHGSDQYNSDKTYVSVIQLPNGSIQRIWGIYSVQQTSQNHIRLHLQMQGFLPRRICAQAPGFQIQCRPNSVPPTANIEIGFLSASALQTNGVTMMRSSGSPLLSAQAPEQLVLAAQAPVAPQMRQPVMPTIHPYATPGGPGSVNALKQDDQLQQYRICAVNGGQVVKEQGGGVRCIP